MGAMFSVSTFIDPGHTECTVNGLIRKNYDTFYIYGNWLPSKKSGTTIVFAFPCGSKKTVIAKPRKQTYHVFTSFRERVFRRRLIVLCGKCPPPPGQARSQNTELQAQVYIKSRPQHVMNYTYEVKEKN